MELVQAVIMVFLAAPCGIEIAGKEEGVVSIQAKVVLEVVLPWFELLKGPAMGWHLIRGTKLEMIHDEGKWRAGVAGEEKGAATTLVMLPGRSLNPGPGGVAGAGRSSSTRHKGWMRGSSASFEEQVITVVFSWGTPLLDPLRHLSSPYFSERGRTLGWTKQIKAEAGLECPRATPLLDIAWLLGQPQDWRLILHRRMKLGEVAQKKNTKHLFDFRYRYLPVFKLAF